MPAASNAAGTYGDFGGRVLTQADPFAPPGHGRFEEHLAAMRSGEQQVPDGPHVEGIALRHGLFYGPGPAGDALVDGLRRRRLPVVSGGGVQPRGYIDDAAATVAALERGAAGSAYNVADDQPVSFSELVRAEVACGRALMAEWLRARHPRRSPSQAARCGGGDDRGHRRTVPACAARSRLPCRGHRPDRPVRRRAISEKKG